MYNFDFFFRKFKNWAYELDWRSGVITFRYTHKFVDPFDGDDKEFVVTQTEKAQAFTGLADHTLFEKLRQLHAEMEFQAKDCIRFYQDEGELP